MALLSMLVDENRLDFDVVQCGNHVLLTHFQLQITNGMADPRFKYYTGYEVDNEPSDDEDDKCTSSQTIAHGQITSER